MTTLFDPAFAADAASLVLRGSLGAFFAISGYHKLFNKTRRASLKDTFVADGVYKPALMYVIPAGEFLGGLALLIGFLTPLAAAGLIAICAGACKFDGFKRIRDWKPLDKADVLDDVLYLPEALYILMALVLILVGPGPLSVDSLIAQVVGR